MERSLGSSVKECDYDEIDQFQNRSIVQCCQSSIYSLDYATNASVGLTYRQILFRPPRRRHKGTMDVKPSETQIFIRERNAVQLKGCRSRP